MYIMYSVDGMNFEVYPACSLKQFLSAMWPYQPALLLVGRNIRSPKPKVCHYKCPIQCEHGQIL